MVYIEFNNHNRNAQKVIIHRKITDPSEFCAKKIKDVRTDC